MQENPYQSPKMVDASSRQPVTQRRLIASCCYGFGTLFVFWATGIAVFGNDSDVGKYVQASLRLSGVATACFGLTLFIGGRRWRMWVAVMGLPLLHIGLQLIRREVF
jgi:hypothetical protein